MKHDAFFIGWSWRSARPCAWFLASVVVVLAVGLAGLGLALGSNVDDPGGGHFGDNGSVTGTLLAEPYPILITDPDPAHPSGHAMLLAGGGKIGVQVDAARLGGHRVQIDGLVVKRGTLDMLLVWKITAAEGAASVPVPQPLGTWRLTGEICDGKCYSGVMRPGAGLAHKACANVCLLAGVPPVLVTTAPVDGSQFLALADPNGHALPDALRDHVAILQRMDGTVSRIADLLVFRTDIAAASNP
jgi:hypothetical protein